jgi:hypothetical protein
MHDAMSPPARHTAANAMHLAEKSGTPDRGRARNGALT